MADRSVPPAGDPIYAAGTRKADVADVHPDELYRAACAAMRLLQDRQQHTPPEMLDPRETKVLRVLREAIRKRA